MPQITGGQGVNDVDDGIEKDQTDNNMQVVAQDGKTCNLPRDGESISSGSFDGHANVNSPVSRAVSLLCSWPRRTSDLWARGESALMRSIGGPQELQEWTVKLFDSIRKG